MAPTHRTSSTLKATSGALTLKLKPSLEGMIQQGRNYGLMSDPDVDPAFLRTVVRAAFNQRRKTLHNSLGQWTRTHGIDLPHGWGRKRAEELPPPAFVELSCYLQALL